MNKVSPFNDLVHQRITVLHNLTLEKPIILITSIKAFIRTIIPKDIFKNEYIKLEKNNEYDFNDLLIKLIELGYERVDRVSEPGSFCVKGGILDIFPSSLEEPVRIDFFGDEIDSIRSFDSLSQKSITELKEVEILPQRELLLLDEYLLKAVSTIEKEFDSSKVKDRDEIIEKLLSKEHFQGIEQFLPFFL